MKATPNCPMHSSKTQKYSGTETLPGCPEPCVGFHCEFCEGMSPSLGLLSILILFHHSQQEPDKQPQEMPQKVWRTKINAQTVVRGAELGQASLGWKTSGLFSFKITPVPRGTEMLPCESVATKGKGGGQGWTTLAWMHPKVKLP